MLQVFMGMDGLVRPEVLIRLNIVTAFLIMIKQDHTKRQSKLLHLSCFNTKSLLLWKEIHA